MAAGNSSERSRPIRVIKTLRVECVDQNWFTSIDELNEALQHGVVTYNTLRPHENLKYKTPDQVEILNQNLYFYPVAA